MAGLNPGRYLRSDTGGFAIERQAKFEEAERSMRAEADNFRRTNRPLAADNLDYYLKGNGAERWIDKDEANRHLPVREANHVNRDRFGKAMLGIGGSKPFRANLERLRSSETPEREWFDLGTEHWDREVGPLTNFWQWLVPGGGDDDFAVGVGQSKMRARGPIQGRRVGAEIEFRGTVAHGPMHAGAQNGKQGLRFGERYDFNKGEFGAERGRLLEGAGRAKPYSLKWLELERVTARTGKDTNGQWRFTEAPKWEQLGRDDIDDPDTWFSAD